MPKNPFAKVVDYQHVLARNESVISGSKLIYGKVITVDPLSIEVENGEILPSKFFHLLDAVRVKKVRFIVHRMHGEPQKVQFTGSASEVSNSANMLLFNLGASSGAVRYNMTAVHTSGGNPYDWSVSPGRPPIDVGGGGVAVTGPIGAIALENFALNDTASYAININDLDATQTMTALTHIFNAKDDIAFRLEFIEKAENQPQIDKPQQNQTVAIEGIIWQGLRVGDVVQMTSHNENKAYQVSAIINRKRGDYDYEQAIFWDSRLNDIPETKNIPRH